MSTTTAKKNRKPKGAAKAKAPVKKASSKAASKSSKASKASSKSSKAASKSSKASSKSSKSSSKASKVSSKSSSKVSVVEEVVESVVEERAAPAKLVATKESVLEHFGCSMLEDVEAKLLHYRETKERGEHVKFLRGLAKRMKNLRTKTTRVIGKKSVKRRSNGQSGFLKPVAISKEMAKFTGWVPAELKSRVDVTKFICNYIKEHNLQNPQDKREIFPDAKLHKLLNIKSGDPPLTYYRIQSYMKHHFNQA
jgi:chromatin remodeling complex protein RSC6